jgi:hypothetical protein
VSGSGSSADSLTARVAEAGNRLTDLERSLSLKSSSMSSADIQSGYVEPTTALLAEAESWAADTPAGDQTSTQQLQALIGRIRYVLESFTRAYNNRVAWEGYQNQQSSAPSPTTFTADFEPGADSGF